MAVSKENFSLGHGVPRFLVFLICCFGHYMFRTFINRKLILYYIMLKHIKLNKWYSTSKY